MPMHSDVILKSLTLRAPKVREKTLATIRPTPAALSPGRACRTRQKHNEIYSQQKWSMTDGAIS
jgi:hypothetical protein